MKYKNFGLISIIMAAYNAENTIGQAIDSALKQTYPDFELLVIDDCSKDCTVEVVRYYMSLDARVKMISNTQNQGVSYTRKRGLEESKGAWIAILDSDDVWMTDKLEKQIQLQRKTNAEFLFTGSAFMDANGQMMEWYLHVPKIVCYRQLLKQNIISNSSVLVSKYLYEKFYATGDDMHEDYAAWLGILRTGKKAYGVDEPLLIYRIAASSKSGNKLKSAKMNWNTYRHMELGLMASIYYECWYILKGALKYKHLKYCIK